MELKRVCEIYFSATGTTSKVVKAISGKIADLSGAETFSYDFTLPGARKSFPEVGEGDIVIFGMPTYAGRLPNLMLKYLDTIAGNGALAVPAVTFGNRNFDNSLIELRNILEAHGFHTIAGAAFSCEHSFSYDLGAGRPDSDDIAQAEDFAAKVWTKAEIILKSGNVPAAIEVAGDSEAGYYQPRDRHSNPIDIRKVKPKTNDDCVKCGLCIKECPMGAIDPEDPSNITGICIKCGSCFKKCPVHAKYFDDQGYLYHKSELEFMYAGRRAENSFFI